VTTGQITRIARHFRAGVIDNLLVGFKYMADVLRQLEENGNYEDVRGTPEDFVIATEESHGAMLTPHIRDKDAGAAALVLAEAGLDQMRHNQTLFDYIDRLARVFGYFHNEGIPIYLPGLQGRRQMTQLMERMREDPPHELVGRKVTRFEDLRDEMGRMGPLKGATDAAARNVLLFQLGEQARIALRPSGTEPKAKIYLEVCTPPCPVIERPAFPSAAHSGGAGGTPTADWQQTCRETDELAQRLGSEFLHVALAKIGLDPSAAGMK
jgi:phosphoglucomutase/phosphomannomutase